MPPDAILDFAFMPHFQSQISESELVDAERIRCATEDGDETSSRHR